MDSNILAFLDVRLHEQTVLAQYGLQMKANPAVVADLQTTCQILSTMIEQYRVDQAQFAGIDLDWLKHRVHKWYAACESHLETVLKRLIYFESNPQYQSGKVTSGGTVGDVLARELAAAQGAFDQCCTFRVNAWNNRADGVPDIYEHLIQDLEKQVFKIERELWLIKGLDLPGYIAARLEDG